MTKLEELKKEDKYLFHGSALLVKELEPRQPKTYDEKLGQMVNDGEPAVCCTPFLEMAIFRAIVNDENTKNLKSSWSRFGKNGDILEFETTQEVLDEVKNKVGYLYVFKKEDFSKYNAFEWRSPKKVTPIETVKVTYEDLPDNITLI